MTYDWEWASARTIYRYFWTLHRHYNLIQWTQLTLGLLWGSYHTWNILHRPKRTGKRNNLKKKKAWQKSESDDNVEEEQKNAEELFINLQLFRDRFVTIHGIIHWRIKNSGETMMMILPVGFFAPAFLGSNCFWRRCPSSIPLHISISGLAGCIFNFLLVFFVFVPLLLSFVFILNKKYKI